MKYEGWAAITLLIKEQEIFVSADVAVIGEGSSKGSMAMATTLREGEKTFSDQDDIDVIM